MLTQTSSPALVAALLVALVTGVACQQKGACGQPGQPCCCKDQDWQNPRCCSTGLKCAMFGGQGFGTPPVVQQLCLPAPQSCGGEGSPCCLYNNNNGFISGSCSGGLSCIPGSVPYGSKTMFDRLAGGISAAVTSKDVVGICRKGASCNAAYSPCGKAAGCGSASCPSGFYCASSFDAGVGDRCIPLPENAGKPGGPCLPNNLPDAPVVQTTKYGQQYTVAPPFCTGSAVCFTPTGGDTTGFTFDKPTEAKALATRITGTLCVSVPGDCGKGVGKPCCPTDANAITDKPLPSRSWGGDACDGKISQHGAFCDGNYSALANQPLGKCAANRPCGGPGQPCCRYSKADMAGINCPNLGRPGAGYCALDDKCKLCPKIAYSVEEVLRCHLSS